MSDTREQYRQVFHAAWQKHQQKQPLSALEEQLVAIILQHPEYHTWLNDQEHNLCNEFTSDNNPYLHMSLHLSLLEQVSLNRPRGMHGFYHQLCQQLGDPHQAEHQMIEVLADHIWQVQHHQQPFNETAYLSAIEKLLQKKGQR